MGMAVGKDRGGLKNEINVTPMVDVVLVLLIIFMVVTPMLQRGKEVTLPKTQSVSEKAGADEADPLILSITPDKKVFLEKNEYDQENLETALTAEIDKVPGRKLLLKGDTSLQVGTVREVMETARKAGAKGVSLAVEQIKDE